MKKKTLFKDKQKVSIFLPKDKVKEFRVKAAAEGMSLSDFFEHAGTATPSEFFKPDPNQPLEKIEHDKFFDPEK